MHIELETVYLIASVIAAIVTISVILMNKFVKRVQRNTTDYLTLKELAHRLDNTDKKLQETNDRVQAIESQILKELKDIAVNLGVLTATVTELKIDIEGLKKKVYR